MNAARRKKLASALSLIEQAEAIISEVAEAEREAFDNMPESLQNSERGEQTDSNASALEDHQGTLETLISELQDVMM